MCHMELSWNQEVASGTQKARSSSDDERAQLACIIELIDDRDGFCGKCCSRQLSDSINPTAQNYIVPVVFVQSTGRICSKPVISAFHQRGSLQNIPEGHVLSIGQVAERVIDLSSRAHRVPSAVLAADEDAVGDREHESESVANSGGEEPLDL